MLSAHSVSGQLVVAAMIAAGVLTGGCSSIPGNAQDEHASPSDLIEVFDHVRVSRSGRFVEFDGIVPLDSHDEETPDVYLELIACSPDTREHESLVMTRARPSHIHAALLLIGLEPGLPGSWERVGDGFEPIMPTGSAVEVTITYTSGNGEAATSVTSAAQDWVIDQRSESGLAGAEWIFAGSRMVEYRGQSFYDADGTGTVIGLTTFGSEVIGWGNVFSPEASVQEPIWIANAALVPAQGTPVVVRISAVDKHLAR